jgi:hypothetical protein
LGLLYLAGGAAGLSWGIEWYDAAVGLIALPAIGIAVGFAARRHGVESVQFTGPLAICLNCAVIVALAVNPYTGPGTLLFYGATLFVAAWRGQPGCEATVLSNVALARDDQLGCPIFSPIDAAETRRRARATARPAHAPR